MTIDRRQFLHLAAGGAVPAVSRAALAQTYPSRPIRLVVGFPPGGGTDTIARLMGQALSERLGQPFIIETRPGAGTNIGTEAVVRAPGRRPYAALRHRRQRDQRDPLREAQLQLHPRYRSGRRARAASQRHDCQSVFSGEDRAGIRRLCERQSRKDQYGVGRHGKFEPRVGRTVQDADRDRHGARALSRRSSRVARPHRRASARDVRRNRQFACAYQRGHPASPRRDHGNAIRRADGCSRDRRVRAGL